MPDRIGIIFFYRGSDTWKKIVIYFWIDWYCRVYNLSAMGCVLSEEQKQAVEAAKISKQINKSIQEDYKRSLKEVKFLLLGKCWH